MEVDNMATNKELTVEVKNLQERVTTLQNSNSNLRDEIVQLKTNYTRLVDEVSQRLQMIHNTFHESAKK